MDMPTTTVVKQHLIDPEICIRCNTCESICPVHAITHDSRNYVVDVEKCKQCMACISPCPTGSIHHTREFEGSDYSLESMVRRFVKVPVPAYKPKKSGEDDPAILPILERGLRYIDEFAQPEGKEKESDGAGA